MIGLFLCARLGRIRRNYNQNSFIHRILSNDLHKMNVILFKRKKSTKLGALYKALSYSTVTNMFTFDSVFHSLSQIGTVHIRVTTRNITPHKKSYEIQNICFSFVPYCFVIHFNCLFQTLGHIRYNDIHI